MRLRVGAPLELPQLGVEQQHEDHDEREIEIERVAPWHRGRTNDPVLVNLSYDVLGADSTLQRSGGGPCFGATYSAPFKKSDATIFKDRGD
jgi:hypothetical protein